VPSGEDLLKLARQNPPAEKSSPIVMAQPLKRDQPVAETVGSLAMKPELSAPQAPTETRAFSSFADIIALVVEKRDVKLKGDLERFVRPIRVAAGQIDWPEQERLRGFRWCRASLKPGPVVAGWCLWPRRVAKSPSLSRKRCPESAFRGPRGTLVQAILKRFPGATVTDVRDPKPKPMEENDEESQCMMKQVRPCSRA
jgi:hypothetical protein